jgi:1,4-alpha-glucan branching enzyme
MIQAQTSQSDRSLQSASMPPLPSEAVELGAVDAIVSASHGDPFAVLGPHEIAPGVWDVRVMQPNAEQIELLDFYEDRLLGHFEQVHRAGFFVARVQSQYRPGYRLKIRDGGGERIVNDPYLFGSSLSADDIAAISYSNDTAFYFIFGAHPVTLGGVWGTRFVVWAPKMK